MRRRTAFTLITLFSLILTVTGSAAQQALNYLVRGIASQVAEGQVVVDFTVLNSGDPVTAEVTAHLFDGSGRDLSSGIVEPLGANESVRMTLAVPISEFTPGSSQTLYAVIGLNQLPPLSQRTLFGNIGSIQVQIPRPPAATPLNPITPSLPGGIRLPAMSLDWINLRDPLMWALIFGIFLIVFIVVFVLVKLVALILRALFSRPPVLPAWQPPYIITPLIDPNSTNGRRQLWQQHAESDTLPAPCAPGNYMVRKLLIGSDGAKLGGWRVNGLRISQYDRYGRVARSQVVLPKGVVRSLDRAVRKSANLNDPGRAENAVRSAAHALTATLLKKMSRQNAILPIALDIRFFGMHGEVRILFELYGCNAGAWQEIDHWEPEMRVVNGSIYENFTYTLLGQFPQENSKQFRQRLEGDMRRLLAVMVQAPPRLPPIPPVQAQDTVETAAVSE
ncbi:MAG: hypothetical protein ABI835_04200 [Chloroflexota bacterium]